MTVAPPVPPSGPESGINGSMPAHVNMPLPRFHPIAMNPTQQMPPDVMIHNHPHYRHFPPSMQEHGPPGPPPHPASPLDHIEARLKQLEQEEAARMAARSHLLAIRKREDEEFRRVTENAEFEEEDLRRQRKRLKRESMGLGPNAPMDSPPLRPTPPRRLSETNAATTLAFFKQQSPMDPRPPQPPQPPAAAPAPAPPAQLPPHPIPQEPAVGSIRRKQKYTIKNVEAWGERHGRPASHDPSGRALWKRPSDGSLVYLTCPVPGCGKADFVTLHGFMCHLTKKHKDRSLGSQSRALEVCGVVYDPNAPLPPVSTVKRASTEESRLESTEGYQQEMDYSSGSEDDDDERESSYGVKRETTEGPLASNEEAPAPQANSSTKQTISSIIDNPEEQTRETLRSMPHSNESNGHLAEYTGSEKPFHGESPQSEKENEPNGRDHTMS